MLMNLTFHLKERDYVMSSSKSHSVTLRNYIYNHIKFKKLIIILPFIVCCVDKFTHKNVL